MPIFKADDEHLDPDSVPRPVMAMGVAIETAPDAFKMGAHHHRKAQLVYSARGTLTCDVADGLWIVPPGCALWIPGGARHSVKGVGDLEVYSLFVDTASVADLPEACCTVSVSPMLREILLRCAEFPALYPENGRESRLVSVLLDELAAAPVEKLHLPMPSDDRLRTIADAMASEPSARASMQDLANRVGVSERTLSRLVLQETGMSFGRWRQQLHISLALQWLSQGLSVQSVAMDLGYESASSFVYMFRKALGSSPARYMTERLSGSASDPG
ncbi:AraC family transcriptional regulator [Singulisphaera sp. PoT]|uniref:AraC family transcriptional regulator n=1 Tax=Singulisphaera sp. PoT TaxID=3411797 RepID=UPI003BF4ED2C